VLKSKPKVYLAGPISGLTHDQCVGWRNEAADKLAAFGIACFSPMRGKGYLRDAGVLEQSYPRYALSTDRGIMSRDHNDVITADALLINLAGVQRVTVGTVMEIAWAWDRHIPTITIMEDKGNPHDHPMVREAIGWRVRTLDEAIHCVKSVLLHE
jgi:nucleoside 2-deoxyribosyltransferase